MPTSRRIDNRVRVRREIWVDPEVLESAQRHLGTTTETETVEVALDLVVSRGQRKRRAYRSRPARADGGAD